MLREVMVIAFVALVAFAVSADADPIPVDVTAEFQFNAANVPMYGAVCVIGSTPELGSWSEGIQMGSWAGWWRLYVTFPAGTDSHVEYLYQVYSCENTEDLEPRVLELPTDGTTGALAEDTWENGPAWYIDGSYEYFSTDLCLQVCLQGVEHSGPVQLLQPGSDPLEMYSIGPDLYQTCIHIEGDFLYPVDVYYRYAINGGDVSEDFNRWIRVWVPPDEMTFTHGWNDGSSICEPVEVMQRSWSTVKSMFDVSP